MPQRRFCSSALLPSAHRTESSVPSFSRQGKGCASWVAFPRFLACTCFANGQVLFYEHRYTSRNGACAQAKSAQFHVRRNQAFPVSPARDKGVPDGEEVQVPVALRGTCFVMRQVLFLCPELQLVMPMGFGIMRATDLLTCAAFCPWPPF